MFQREYGLVHNPSNPDRFVRLVKWEQRWVPFVDDEGPYEGLFMYPTIWEWTLLDVSNPRALTYSGPVMRLVPTAITELGFSERFTWPRDAPSESETVRRDRIRAIRRACHVDPDKGEAEPKWVVEKPRVRQSFTAPPSVWTEINAAA